MRKLFIAIFALLLASCAAHAQTGGCKSAAALNTEVNTFFPDNSSGAVTPAVTRQMLLNMIASGDCLVENGDSNFVIPNNSTAAVTSTTFSAARTWTLPAAANSTPGAILIVADMAGGVTSVHTLTIQRAGSDTINGTNSVMIQAAYGAYLLISDGVSKWTAEALGTSGGGGGSVSAGGTNTQVQFNSSGVLAGDTGFTYFGSGAAFLGFAGTSTGILGFAGAGSGAGDVDVQADPNTGSTYNLVWPTSAGTNGFVLQGTVGGSTVSLGWASPTITVNSVPCTLAGSCTIPMIVGTTAINSGTNLNILYDNNGVLGIQGISGSGNVVLTSGAVMSNVDITSASSITGLPAPVNASDAATKAYVDASSAGLVIHTPVQWATAAVLPNSPTYNNGASGVGATLTAGSNAAIVVDGANPVSSDRVLVKNQASALQNGVYSVTTQGSGTVAWVLTRTTDFNAVTSAFGGSCTPASSCIAPDSYFFVQPGGTVNANSSWVLTNTGTVTVGTTSLTWAQFSASSTYSAGTGLNLTGSTFSLASPYVSALTSSGGTINFSGTPSTGQIPVASTASTGAWTTLYTQPINVLSKGGNNLGTADNVSAISSGLAALATPGACLYFPGGYYSISTQIAYVMPAGSSSVCFEGDALGSTVLFWPHAAGGISIGMSSPAQSVHFRNLSLLTQQAGGGTALNVTQSSPLGEFVMSTVEDVYIGAYTNNSATQTWNNGIVWNKVSGTEISNVQIYGPLCSGSCTTTVGVQYEGGTSAATSSIYHYLHDSILNQLTNAVSINAWTQGVFMDKLNIQNGQQCTGGASATCGAILIGGSCPGGDDRTEFNIFNSQIENTYGGAGILVKCAGAWLTVVGNQFTVPAGDIGIYIDAGFNFVNANANTLSCGTTGTCIESLGGWGTYYGNQLQFASTGINFTSSGVYNTAYGNQFVSVTTGQVDLQSASTPALPFVSNAPLSITANAQVNGITTSNSGGFIANLINSHGSAGDHGLAIFAGANGPSDSTSLMIDFVSANASNVLGTVSRSGTGVAYNTSSDIRLKENIAPTTRGLADLLRIPVEDFNWRADPQQTRVQGFIAQDLFPVYPEAVHVGGDDPATNPWTVDYGRMTPLLVQSIKDLTDRVEALEHRIH